MSNAFKFLNPKVHGIPEFSLSDLANQIFEAAVAGQGFVGMVDLLTGEIHLCPVYENEDEKIKMPTIVQKYAVMESSRKNLGRTPHEKAISQLMLGEPCGRQFLGFGCVKGTGNTLLDSFSNRSASLNLGSIEYSKDYIALNDSNVVERSIPDVLTEMIMDILVNNLPLSKLDQKRGVKENLNTKLQYSTVQFNKMAEEDIRICLSEDSVVNLHEKLFGNKNEFIDYLSMAPYKINEVNEQGQTLLMRAVENNRIDLVETLIEHGASINVGDRKGKTAITLSIENNYFLIARKLYECHATTDLLTRVLILVATENNIQSTELPNLSREATAYEKEVMNLILLYSIENGESCQLVADLLQKGASDAVDKDGNTAVIIAVKKRNHEVVEKLLGSCSLINKKNRDRNTALFLSASFGGQAMVEMLLRSGASPNMENSKGLSILMSASQENKQLIEKALNQHEQISPKKKFD